MSEKKFGDGEPSSEFRKCAEIINQLQKLESGEPSSAPPARENLDVDYTRESVAATAYQICGVLNAPVRILDYFSAVAQGKFPTNPLPFSPDEFDGGAAQEVSPPSPEPNSSVDCRCSCNPMCGCACHKRKK